MVTETTFEDGKVIIKETTTTIESYSAEQIERKISEYTHSVENSQSQLQGDQEQLAYWQELKAAIPL